ncbi:MAG: Ig-like domain repeat protein [Planctomycetes bacterium]|nr:Ig-like domain repeat protein [Planctomycetota bacterium]
MRFAGFWLLLSSIAGLPAVEPLITAVAPDTGTSASDGVTSATTLTVSGTGDDGAVLELLAGASDPPTAVVASGTVAGGVWSVAWSSGVAVPSLRYLRPRTILLGVTTGASSSVAVTIDPLANAPAIASVSAPAGAQPGWTNQVRPTVAGTADHGSTVDVFVDGTPVASTTADAAGAWSVAIGRDLTTGTHSITATQTDIAGNGESAPTAATVVHVDYVTSELVVYSSTTGLTSNPAPAYAGKAEVGATVELHSGSASGPLIGSVTADGSGLWSLSPAGAQPDGAYVYHIVARDAAGNTASAGPFAVTIDTVVVGSLAITGFQTAVGTTPDGGTTALRSVTVRGTLAGAETGATVAVSVNGRSIGSATVASGSWSIAIPTTLNDALYLVDAVARDPAGNATASTGAAFIVNGPAGAEEYKPQLDAELGGGLSLVTTDTTPTITGLARPGATVTVNLTPGPASPGTVTATGTGTFSFTPSSPLADGTYAVVFSNADGSSPSYSVTIDTQAPGAAGDIAVSDDTGSSATDRITWDDRLIFQATGFADPAPAAAPLTATLRLDGSSVATATVDGAGTAVFDLSGRVLPDGVYTVAVSARDAAGNAGPAISRSLAVDRFTDPPLITGISPDTGLSGSDGIAQITAGSVITGRAEAGASVQLTFSNGSRSEILTAVANGSGVFATAAGALHALGLDEGQWTITPVATDTAGNTNLASHHPGVSGSRPSSGFTMEKDDTPPTVSAAISDDTGSSSSDNLTRDDRLTVSGSTEGLAQVVVTFDDGVTTHAKTVRASAAGSYTADFTDVDLSDGAWTLTAQPTDLAGNAGTAAVQTVTIDTVPPAVTIASTIAADTFGSLDAIDSGTASDRITNDTDILVSGTVEAGATVVLRRDGSDVGAAGVVGTDWQRQSGTLAAGSRTLVARATDAAGNTADSAGLAVQIDVAMADPTVSRVSPSQGFVGGGAVGGTWTTNATTVAIEVSGETAAILHLAYRLGGAGAWTELATQASSAGKATWAGIDLSALAPAGVVTTFDLRANGVDHAGNACPGFGTATLVVDRTVPIPAPAITAVADDTTPSGAPWNGAPYSTDRYTRDNRVVVSGTGADAASGYVRVYVNGVAKGWVAVPAGGSWSLNLGAAPFNVVIPDGAVTFTATNGDLAGNEGPVSAGYAMTVDTRRPSAAISGMTTADTGRSGTDRITQTSQPAFHGTATDGSGADDDSVPLLVFTLKRGGTTVQTVTAASTDSGGASDTWDYTTPAGQPDGAYTLQVVAHDLAGNTASAVSTTFTIDRTAAAPGGLKLTAATDSGSSQTDLVTNVVRPTVTGSVVEGHAYVRVYRDSTAGALIASATAASNGSWSAPLAADLAEGANVLAVVQEDVAGNVSAASTLTVTLDTLAPAVPSVDRLTAATDSGISDSDQLTRHADPAVQGGCAADTDLLDVSAAGPGGATVAHTHDVVLGDVAWTQTFSGLPEGAWQVAAVAVDLAGNRSAASPALAITVDRTPPLIAITGLTPATDSGLAGDGITSVVRPELAGSIGTDAVAMELVVTGVGTFAPVPAAGAWSWMPAAALADAAYPCAVTASDAAGNVSSIVRSSFTVDTVAPAKPSLDSITVDSGNSSDWVTNDSTLFFHGRAEAGSRVSLMYAGRLMGAATADASGRFVVDYTAHVLADGTYSGIYCQATDAAGNQSAVSDPRTLVVDTGAGLGPPLLIDIATDSNIASDWVTNDNTPLIRGVAKAQATVTVTYGGSPLGSAVADIYGQWSLQVATPLADQTATVAATQRDLAGNDGSGPASRSMVIDTGIGVPAIVSVSVDSGRSASDAITNDATLSVSGTAEPLCAVTLRADGAVVGTATADAGGAWTLGASALAEGAHALIATAADLAGNSAASLSFPVVVDLTAPPAPVIASWSDDTGTAGDGVTADSTPTLVGTAEASAIVTVRDAGVVLGTALADGAGAWNLVLPARADGLHQFTATATDVAGNVSGTRAATPIRIDTATTAPVVSGALPDTGRSATDRITNAATVNVRGSAEAGATVTLRDGASDLGTALADAQGAWSLDIVPTEGVLSLNGVAVDAAGNSAGPGAALLVTVDRTAPAEPVVVLPASPTNDTTPTITGTTEPDALVDILIGGAVVGTAVADGGGAWSWTSAVALSDAVYSISAQATDAAGNTSSPAAAQDLAIDTGAPAVLILGVSPDTGTPLDGITTSTTPILVGVATPDTAVEVVLGGATSTVHSDARGLWILPLPDDGSAALADGAYDFTATAYDAAGNASLPSTYHLVVDATPPAPPVIDVVTPSAFAGGVYTVYTGTPDIGGSAGSAEAGSTVALSIDGTRVGTAVAAGDGSWTVHLVAALAPGRHTCVATATDLAGGASVDSAAIAVQVGYASVPVISAVADDTVPAAVAPWDGAPYANDAYTRDTRVIVSGAGADAAAGFVRVLVNGVARAWVATPAGGAWSIDLGAAPFNVVLTDGQATLTAVNYDAAGNAGLPSASYVLTVDTRKPSVAITGMSSFDDSGRSDTDRITNQPQPRFNGTVSDLGDSGGADLPLAEVTVTRGATTVDSALLTSVDSGGSDDAWSYTLPAGQPDGSYAIAVVARDLAGNVSLQASATFVLDTTAASPTGLHLAAASDTGESASDGITSLRRPVITGDAVEGLAYVRVYRGSTAGQLIGSATAAADGTWSATLGADLAEGAQALAIVQVDVAGNTSAAGVLNVTLDTTAPAAASVIGLTPATDTGLHDDDGVTMAADPAARGGCPADADGLILTATGPGHVVLTTAIDLVLGATAWQQVMASLPEGAWQLTAVAVDTAGNRSATSASYTVRVDRTAPLVAIIGLSAATDSGTVGDGLTNAARPQLLGSCGADAISIVLTGAVAPAPVLTGISWSWTPGVDLADGAYPVAARAFDLAGNASLPSAATFTIDRTPPAQPSIDAIADDNGPSATDFWTNDPTLEFIGQAEAASSVRLTQAGDLFGVATADAGGAFRYDFTSYAIPDGIYPDVIAVAVDAAGNSSAPSVARELRIDTGVGLGPPLFTSLSQDSGTAGDWITNDSTPLLVGRAKAGATVTVRIGVAVLGTAVADANGRWSLQVSTALPDQTATLTATQRDAFGNDGSGAASHALTIDTAIAAPAIVSVATDSGRSSIDRITNDASLAITGAADPFTVVTVTSDGAAIGSATTDATGVWSLAAATFVEGSHTLGATAVDTAGNSATASSVVTTVDLTAPPAPVISSWSDDTGALGDGITADRTPTLTGLAEALAIITIRDGATVLGTVTAAADGAWTYAVPGRSDGAHAFTATATDIAGNTGAASAATSIVVDTVTVTPQVTAISPDSGRSSSDRITNATVLTVRGTAEAASTVTIRDGATTLGTAIADANGAWSVATTPAEGVLALRATASDPAGNPGGPGTAMSVTIDRTAPPAPTLAGPTSPTNDTTPTLSGVAEADARVAILVSGLQLAIVPADPATGAWSWTPSVALPDAIYSIQVRATDIAGNTGPLSATMLLEIDTDAPAVLILGVSPDTGDPADGVTSSTRPLLVGVASPGSSIEIVQGATTATSSADANGIWYLQLPDDGSSDLADGPYTFAATAYDAAGNASTASDYLLVVDTTAPTAPVIDVVSPSAFAGGIYTTPVAAPSIGGGHGTAEPGAVVSLVIDGNPVGTAVAGATGAWSVALTADLVKGYHQCSAYAIDAAGNQSADGAEITLLVNLPPPEPVITSLSPDTGVAGDARTADPRPSFHGTSEPYSTVEVTIVDGSTQVAVFTAVADALGEWTGQPAAALADAAYAAEPVATDVYGNVRAGASFPFVIDAIPDPPDTQVLILEGEVSANVVRVSIGGRSVQPSGGRYRLEVPVPAGMTDLAIELRDANGRITTGRIAVGTVPGANQ